MTSIHRKPVRLQASTYESVSPIENNGAENDVRSFQQPDRPISPSEYQHEDYTTEQAKPNEIAPISTGQRKHKGSIAIAEAGSQLSLPADNRAHHVIPTEKNGLGPSSGISSQPSRHIRWRSPALMLVFFIVGILFALGHHLYYQSLDGTTVNSESQQVWAIRIGTGLAFLQRTTLGAALGIAFTQHLWTSFQKKDLRLAAIDSMFSMTGDPLSFINGGVLLGAKILTVLALVSWFLPLAATITPATLAVRSLMASNITQLPVPFLAFDTDSAARWGIPSDADGFGGPTPLISRLLSATASSAAILSLAAPFPNSSYTISFHGPAFKCSSLASALQESRGQVWLDLDLGNLTLGEIWNQSVAQYMSDFTLWLAAAPIAFRNGNLLLNAGGTDFGGSLAKNLSCQLYNASYTVEFGFSNGVQSILFQDFRYLSATDYDTGSNNINTTEEMAYLSYATAFGSLLVGEIGIGSTGTLFVTTAGNSSIDLTLGYGAPSVLHTGIAACPEIKNSTIFEEDVPGLSSILPSWLCRNSSVEGAIEDLSRNFTMSLFTSSALAPAENVTAAVTSHFPQNHYTYNAMDLFLAYGIAIAVVAICVVVGLRAYIVNGYSASASFSTILLTTRNDDLDKIAQGHWLGSQPLAEDLHGLKLRFGMLEGSDGRPHPAFGLKGTVKTMK